jgi:hypothetical protein
MNAADDVKVSGDAAPARRAARMLVAARRERRLIERLPLDCRPGDLAAGYAVQAQVAGMLGAIGGWTIGAADPEVLVQIGDRGWRRRQTLSNTGHCKGDAYCADHMTS